MSDDRDERRKPPKKQPGQATGPRTINGALLDVRSGAGFLGVSEKKLRGMVDRRLITFRRLGGRIVFVRQELEGWLTALDGCSVDEAVTNMQMRSE